MTKEDIKAIKLLVEYMVGEEVKKQIPTIKKLLIAEMKASKGQVQKPIQQQRPQQQVKKSVALFKGNRTLNEIFSTVDDRPEELLEQMSRPKSKAEEKLVSRDYTDILNKMGVQTSEEPVERRGIPQTQPQKPKPSFNIAEIVTPFGDDESKTFNWEDEL